MSFVQVLIFVLFIAENSTTNHDAILIKFRYPKFSDFLWEFELNWKPSIKHYVIFLNFIQSTEMIKTPKKINVLFLKESSACICSWIDKTWSFTPNIFQRMVLFTNWNCLQVIFNLIFLFKSSYDIDISICIYRAMTISFMIHVSSLKEIQSAWYCDLITRTWCLIVHNKTSSGHQII